MLLRERIAHYFEDIETPLGIAVNGTILALILLSMAIFVAETYPITESVRIWLKGIDVAILIIFSLEYLIRFYGAASRLKFFFSFFSVVDLIAIIPLFLGWLDLRFLRILRWFRFLRVFRFFKFEVSLFKIVTEDGVIFARIILTLFAIVFICSGLIYQVEHQVNPQLFRNFFDALYFSVVTMTTVGFGDLIPLSESGRVVTLLMILTGVLVIPWQVGDLVKQFLKTVNKVNKSCPNCSLAFHDKDAIFCKVCGTKLAETPQIPS